MEKKQFMFLTSRLVIFAEIEDGRLISSCGMTAKVEQIEMNHAKITHKNGKEQFVSLDDETVRWLEEVE